METDAENEFETFVTSSGGTTLLSILTEDYNGNVAASPRQWTFASAGTVGGSFAYNGGNLAGQNYPRPAQYTWDAEDRLKTATVDGHTYEFAYDAFGRRVREKVDGTATRTWVWDGMAIVEERSADGATVRKRFYPQGEQWVGGTKPGKYYYTFDHLGSIREMTDASRNVVARYAYAPYGEATKTQGDLDASFTYTGHFAHGGSGLLLAPYRAYDPVLGRWLSRDPIGEAGGINLYGYSNNNPINLTDRLGLAWESTQAQGVHYNDRKTGFGFGLSVDESGRVVPVPLSGKNHSFDADKAQKVLDDALGDESRKKDLVDMAKKMLLILAIEIKQGVEGF